MIPESLLASFQARLRCFAFGAELDRDAAQLLRLLAPCRRRRADIHDRQLLKALALIAEYLDALGRTAEAAALLRLTVDELAADALSWPAELAQSADPNATRRLLRQRVWCVMAYAHTGLRAHRQQQAGHLIERMRAFVNDHLAAPNFPCHGTHALIRYYSGLWRRNLGQLNEAARDFDAALDHMHLRLQDKQRKYAAADPDRLRRETIYHRVSMARVLGFGHGGIALARGRYVDARGWLLGAQQILAQLGQEMWRNGLEVYVLCATVLVQELAAASRETLSAKAARLDELARWFAPRNPRLAFLAEAFSLIAAVRLRQIDGIAAPLNLEGLRRRLDTCLKAAPADSAPLSATAALHLMECLLRSGDTRRCEAALDRWQRVWGDQEESGAEFAVLRAELWIETGRHAPARALLANLLEQRPANRAHRARAWALLAVCEQTAGQSLWAARAIAAARDALQHVQDGFVRAWVADWDARFSQAPPVAQAMPYQQPDEDGRWCDLDHNLEAARLHVVEQVYRRYPGHTVEKLAAVMGRGHSWLYGFLGSHRDLPWVRELLAR